VGWLTLTIELALVFLGIVLTLIARRWMSGSFEFDFEPELSITRKNGWALLDLVLVNHCKVPISAEVANFAFADVDADFQGAAATEQSELLLRAEVAPGDTLRVSLLETVYTACGKPQGEYSFLISGTVRYRVNDNWFEISLQTYRVRMIALSAVRLLRMRWYDQPAAKRGQGSRLRKISNGEERHPRSKQ
jgi:hypothetical protein